MKQKHIIRWSFCYVLAAVLAACADENSFPDSSGYTPSLSARYLFLSASGIDMEATASTRQVDVQAISTPWQFQGFDTSWLNVSPANGNSDQSVSITATENLSATDMRTSVFFFESTAPDYSYQQQVSVTQQKAAPFLKLQNQEQSRLSVNAMAATLRVPVVSNVSWQPSASSAWLSVSRDGEAIVIKLSENTDSQERTATVTATADGVSATLTVTQAPAVDPSITPEVTETLSFPNGGGAYQLSIKSEVAWTASSSQSWVAVNPTKGTAGTATLTIETTRNTSTEERTGNVYISIGSTRRITIPIRQDGVYLNVRPTELSFTADAQTQQLTVESNTNWTVLSRPQWLSVNTEGGGSVGTLSGNATLQLTAVDNWNDAARTGTLTLGQEGTTIRASVTVTQQGRSFSVSPTVEVTMPSKGGTHQVTISGNSPWTATSTSTWMQLSQKSGNGNVKVTMTTPDRPSIYSREDETTFTPTHQEQKAVTIRTKQEGRYLTIDASNELYFFRSGGVSDAITINTDASYSITTSATWLTIQRSGNTFTAKATANTTGQDRTATITIAMTDLRQGEKFSVKISVLQYYISPGIIIATFTDDEQWDIIRSSTATITITGFGSDENWSEK